MVEDQPTKVAIVVSEGTFDKAMMAMMLANTAASMGMEVRVFFTFFGLNLLKKNANPKLGGFYRLFTGVFRNRMAAVKIPAYQEQRQMAMDLGVQLCACSTTMGLMKINKEDMVDGVKILGAGGFLGYASETQMQFFIG